MKNYNSRSLLKKSASPICVRASNYTDKVKEIKLFGSEFNDFENEDVVPSQINVTYSQIQKKLLNTSYEIGCFRIIFITYNKKLIDGKKVINLKKSKENLKNLVITVKSADPNGQSMTIPLIISSYIHEKQVKKNIADIAYELNLSGSVELSFNLPENSSAEIFFFPYSKNNINSKQYYSLGLIDAIRDVKHPFSEVLFNKINELSKLKKEVLSSGIKIGFIEDNLNDYEFNKNIDYAIGHFNDIPSDFYRNMVNLYVVVDEYIEEIKFSMKDINVKKAVIKKSSVKKVTSKKILKK